MEHGEAERVHLSQDQLTKKRKERSGQLKKPRRSSKLGRLIWPPHREKGFYKTKLTSVEGQDGVGVRLKINHVRGRRWKRGRSKNERNTGRRVSDTASISHKIIATGKTSESKKVRTRLWFKEIYRASTNENIKEEKGVRP